MTKFITADTYEHDTLRVQFTCTCGKKRNVDLSEKEWYRCRSCKVTLYPTLRLKAVAA